MNAKHIIAVMVIFCIAACGWWILGTATAFRSNELSYRLGPKVEALWGTSLIQTAPSLSVKIPGSKQVRPIMASKNDIRVALNMDYRKKGLIWYPTYTCRFEGAYTLKGNDAITQKVNFHFDFPAKDATYDSFSIKEDGTPLFMPIKTNQGIDLIAQLQPNEKKQIRITYKTRGIGEWRYRMDKNVGRVQNFNLVVETDFQEVDYTEDSLSPMVAEKEGKGKKLIWKADDLITHSDIGIIVPEKLNPGPLVTRITYFAPVCLIFFFVLVTTISVMYTINIHPMHYLFVAAGFFAFHLLLSYLVGHFDIHISFCFSATISVLLVTLYLSSALGKRFPWKPAIAGQLFFLVLFSYSFFIEGITGLTIAIGSVITLAILMKVTAHVDWDKVFGDTRSKNSNHWVSQDTNRSEAI